MPESDPSSVRKLSRPWQVIAEEIQNEANPERVLELSRELNRALEEQTNPHSSHNSSPPKP